MFQPFRSTSFPVPVRYVLLAPLVVSLLILAGPATAQEQVALERVFDDENLFRLTDFRHDGVGRNYVSEQRGTLRVYEGEDYGGLFLDIRDRVGESHKEGGIQSFAFHPEYDANGYLFVEYVAVEPRRTVVSRFTRSEADPLVADPESEEVLLEVEQPMYNHNGGSIAFGPDGYLYIALGDGGNSDEHAVNGQDPTTLLGAVLRIDVDDPDPGLPYGIPPDNPFADGEGPERAEIYAWGLRSPWRLSFDAETGALWLGDVGQHRYEEVNQITLGGNYGWNIMEGLHCYDPPTNCATEGLTLPVWEYDRNGGNSVTGGYVYRGSEMPELDGAYIYGDFASGRIWALTLDSETGEVTNTELTDTPHLIVSFGVDEAGELYVLHYYGAIYKLVPRDVSSEPTAAPEAAPTLQLDGPNPFRDGTRLHVSMAAAGPARIAAYDVLGREVARLHDGVLPAGEHTLTLRADDLAPGTYRVRLTAGDHHTTVPVTRLR